MTNRVGHRLLSDAKKTCFTVLVQSIGLTFEFGVELDARIRSELAPDLLHRVEQTAVRKCADPKSGYGAPGFFQTLGRKLPGFLNVGPRVRGVSLQALLGCVQLHQ